MSSEVKSIKQSLRHDILTRRRRRSPADRVAAGSAIAAILAEMPELKRAKCVAAFTPTTTEPNIDSLLSQLQNREVTVLLPGSSRANPTWFKVGSPAEVVEQLSASALVTADVVVVPALAVDGSGTRLGHGGGWYDRALVHARPDAAVIAVVFDDEFCDHELPREPHDHPVDAVATPSGLRRLRL